MLSTDLHPLLGTLAPTPAHPAYAYYLNGWNLERSVLVRRSFPEANQLFKAGLAKKRR